EAAAAGPSVGQGEESPSSRSGSVTSFIGALLVSNTLRRRQFALDALCRPRGFVLPKSLAELQRLHVARLLFQGGISKHTSVRQYRSAVVDRFWSGGFAKRTTAMDATSSQGGRSTKSAYMEYPTRTAFAFSLPLHCFDFYEALDRSLTTRPSTSLISAEPI